MIIKQSKMNTDKKCKKCGKMKPIEAFRERFDRKIKSHYTICKDCEKLKK